MFELAKNISTKVGFENGRFCTWGSTLCVEITPPRAFKGPLRLAEWGNGFQGLKVGELIENIRTRVDFDNGRFCSWGSTLSVEITILPFFALFQNHLTRLDCTTHCSSETLIIFI